MIDSIKVSNENVCPYCGVKLLIIPTRKTSCKSCGNYIFVKYTPTNKQKILVTEKQKNEIELQWEQHFKEQENNELMKDPDFILAKKELGVTFKQNALMGDVKWRVYEERKQKYIIDNCWGLYRNNKLDQAKLLIEEKRYSQALSLLFEVCFLDINDASNNSKIINSNKFENYFNASTGSYTLSIVSMVEETILKLGYASLEEVKDIFITSNENLMELIPNIPINREVAWEKLINFSREDKEIKSIDPLDIPKIIGEINKRIDQKSFSEATELIYKLKINFKIPNDFHINLIKENLPKWLYSKDFKIARASESILTIFIKKDYHNIKGIAKEYITKVLIKPEEKLSWTTVSQLYTIDKEYTLSLIPRLIEILKNYPLWNVRRVCSYNLGEIGAKDVNLVKEAIPIMIDYIKNPYEVTKHNSSNLKLQNECDLSDLFPENISDKDKVQLSREISDTIIKITDALGNGLDKDQIQWLRDAYITSIGLIAKGNKDVISPYKLLFENIAKKDKFEYTRRKAQEVLNYL